MNTATSPEMETLKSKLKSTWEAGDFSEIAKHIETAAEGFVGRLNIQPGMKVLDVACGSGNLAIVAAKKGAAVTGIDIAANLIEAANKRATAENLQIKGQMFKLAGKYIPPPDMPPPVLWGVPETVAERFGELVTDLKMTPTMAEFRYEEDPAGVVELFRKYFGPTVMAFKAIPAENHEAYRSDMEGLWTANNIAKDGGTEVKSEYLEVIARKK
ncbi:MAG: class I SAM-dependent methyltransferase [Acidobacteria bacterium]|nr:class I SAM-dependent methyltransferase [Acidobacteriota bacterium]